VIIGKTNLNEFAYGVSGYNPHYGAILCPADRRRTAGGSSGGSAVAVACGACDFAVGTDTSGSVRIPAACCNVYGFKAAHGAYSMRGVFPLAPSYDSLGFLAPDVATLARVLDLSTATTPPADHVRTATIGEDIVLPELPPEHWTLFRQEAYAVHAPLLERNPDAYGDDVRLKLGGEIGDVRLATAVMCRWRDEIRSATTNFDVAVGPVFTGPAPTLDAVLGDYRNGTLDESDRLLRNTPVANALGWPAMTVPTASGPRHLLGRPGSEAALLAVASKIGLARADVLAAAARGV
jgi:aspartyl-tRNA(Asn)/glutamyl-tRNA(Gln) amidotransferase subunit A